MVYTFIDFFVNLKNYANKNPAGIGLNFRLNVNLKMDFVCDPKMVGFLFSTC